MSKHIKGEKYIYLAMAYTLAKQNKGMAQIGFDNNYTDGYMFWRRFNIQNYDNKELLIETKSSRACANYSRVFEVKHYTDQRPDFIEYINEAGENGSQRWEH